MNWADMTFVITPLICAFGACTGAAQEKMGWASILFAVGGFAIGYGCGIVARALGVLFLVVACKQPRAVFTFGLLIAYMLVPMAVMAGAFAGTAWLATLIARHFV